MNLNVMPSTLTETKTYLDAPNFADLVDSLRGRVVRFPDAASRVALPLFARELFGRCAQDYERESAKLADRRHRVGTLVYPATPKEASAVSEFFFQRLGLCIVDIDARTLAYLSDKDVEARLATLSEPMAHIVALHGMGPQADPRVFAAIESASADVLVVAFAEPGATFGPAVQRCLRYRIDLQPVAEILLRPIEASGLPGNGPLKGGMSPTPELPQRRHAPLERLFDFFHPALRATRP
jgi:hypothetical protein